MAYIYKITNKINGKIYIGKTLNTIEERWKEHCKGFKRERNEKRPLYSAMKKYGVENFSIEEVEECLDEESSEREVFWIEYFGSFKNGYNATMGGDGKPYLDYDLICETYKQTQSMKETAKICNCCAESVRNILKAKEIRTKPSSLIIQEKYGKTVNMYDKKGNYIRTFASLSLASEYIQSLSPEKRTSLQGIRSHIGDVCRGKRKSAYGYLWKFADK